MGDSELVLLMVSMTKGGKTTIAQTLCHEGAKDTMMAISSDRTRLTVDWAFYKPENATDCSIKVEEILLNENSIRDIFPDKYPDCKEAPKDQTEFLKLFDCNEKERVKWSAFDGIKKHYIENTLNGENQETALREFLSNEHAQKYIRRIKIKLPMRNDMCARMEKLGRTLTLRDTRGMLDIAMDGPAKIEGTCPADLGVDGVDAVLLLCTTMPFANLVQMYAGIYAPVFNAVPVFIMARHDAITSLYVQENQAYENIPITEENIISFINKFTVDTDSHIGWSVNKDIRSAWIAGKELVKSYAEYTCTPETKDITPATDDITDAYYIYPYTASLLSGELTGCISFDTELYEAFILHNISDILSKLKQYLDDITKISECSKLRNDLIEILSGWFNKYDEINCLRVDKMILASEDYILGVRDGITTPATAIDNSPRPTLYTASRVYCSLFNALRNYPDETLVIDDVNSELCRKYGRRILLRRLCNAIDTNATWNNNCILNRYLTRRVYREYRKYVEDIRNAYLNYIQRSIYLDKGTLVSCVKLLYSDETYNKPVESLKEDSNTPLPKDFFYGL